MFCCLLFPIEYKKPYNKIGDI